MTTHDRWVWMPAHQPMPATGHRRLSDGSLLTATDWRANRLVDVLAKQAASTRRAPRIAMAVTRLLKSPKAAARHSAALLRQVTHAASNHRVTTVLANGTQRAKTVRDAAPRGPCRVTAPDRPSKRSCTEARVTAPGLLTVGVMPAMPRSSTVLAREVMWKSTA